MKHAITVVLVNVAALACLILVSNLVLVTWYRVDAELSRGTDDRGQLGNYADTTWADTHFQEIYQLESSYRSFIGWRRKDFEGQTIAIEAGIRATANRADAASAATIAFFGGSTMWGTGSRDRDTIPSHVVAQADGHYAINFGESAYVARQSLNLLLQKYAEGFRPAVVVFYDGANEVLHKCRVELTPFAHGREAYIDSALQSYRERMSFAALVHPLRQFAEDVGQELAGGKRKGRFYDCDRKPEKADMIARALLWDWLAAKQVVEAAGGRFLAILQPVAYLGAPAVEHLDLDAELGRQFTVVYDRIVAGLKGEFGRLSESVADFRDVFDGQEPIYIDFCHVSPNGNEIVAAHIAEILEGPRS